MKKTISKGKWRIQDGTLKMNCAQLTNSHIATFVVGAKEDLSFKIQSKSGESQLEWLRYRMDPRECMI